MTGPDNSLERGCCAAAGSPDGDPGYWEEMVAASALHSLDAEEEAALREHVRSCESCRRMMDDLAGVAAELASVPDGQPADLPPALWDRIVAEIAETEPDRPRTSKDAPPGSQQPIPIASGHAVRRRRVGRRLAIAAAAAALVAAAASSAEIAVGGRPPSPGPAAACQTSHVCQTVSLRSAAGIVAATAFVRPHSVSVAVRHLAPNTKARSIYVLWEMRPGTTPRAVTTFSVGRSKHPSVRAAALPIPYRRSSAITFAISLERGPHAPSLPTGEVAAGAT